MQKWFWGNEVIGLEFDSTDLLSFKTSVHVCVCVGGGLCVREKENEEEKKRETCHAATLPRRCPKQSLTPSDTKKGIVVLPQC